MKTSGPKKIGSNALVTDPGRYKKLGEKWRKNSVRCAGRNSATLKSDGQKIDVLRSVKLTSIEV